jgi:spectrin beta
LQAFDTFLSSLSGNEGRVVSCLQSGQSLVSEGSPQSQLIQLKLAETKQLWEDLKELANARQEVCTALNCFIWAFIFNLII